MSHTHTNLCMTVTVYIVYGDCVLLRRHEKYGLWLGAGGHIDPGEDPNEAALREAKEETGLDIELIGTPAPVESTERYRQLVPPRFMSRHSVGDGHEHADSVYFARARSNESRPENNGDVIAWLGREDLEKNELDIPPDSLHYALAALRELAE